MTELKIVGCCDGRPGCGVWGHQPCHTAPEGMQVPNPTFHCRITRGMAPRDNVGRSTWGEGTPHEVRNHPAVVEMPSRQSSLRQGEARWK